MKKILIILIAAVLIAAIIFYPTIKTEAQTGAGFAAKNICSGHFISGLSGEQVMTEALIPLSPLFTKFDYHIDEQNKWVEASAFGIFNRRAKYTKALGCQLAALDSEKKFDSVIPYQHPLANDDLPWPDGLADVSESELSIDQDKLNKTFDAAFSEPSVVASSESITTDTRQTKAIVVIHKGQLIAERYANGIDKTTPLLSWSMAKSVTGMIAAILIDDGKLSLEQQSLLPIWSQDFDKRKAITLDQLMRMSSGLEFKEIYGLGSDAARMLSVETSAGGFAADKPLVFEAGSHWAYSSGTTNIIASIIRNSFNGNYQAYYAYPQERLFSPLNISTAVIEPDPSGTFIGSSYMYATARDWAKLGQLMLQDGQWNGKQIISEKLVKYLITPTETNLNTEYAAQFWLNGKPAAGASKTSARWPNVPKDTFQMSGFQGQAVVVIPSKELVIVRLGFTKPGTDKGIEKLLEGVLDAVALK